MSDPTDLGPNQVLCLDGPLAGQLHARPVFSSTFMYRTTKPQSPLEFSSTIPLFSSFAYDEHVYYVHRFAIKPYIVWIATTNPAGPDMEDFIEYCLTDEAKECLG